MTTSPFVRAMALAALACPFAIGQPTSRSPLDPPPNSVRRSDPTWHALVGGTVHAQPGRTPQQATVVIRDGKILSVTPGGLAPAGARVWDCTGLHLYPGFIEPYLEVEVPRPSRDDPGRHWNGAVTPQRRAHIGGVVSEAAAKELRDLGYTAAVISPRGGVVRGTASAVSLARRDADASSGTPAMYAGDVYMTVSFETGGSQESLAWTGYPGSQMGAIALLRQTLLDAQWQGERRASGMDTGPANALDALWRQRRPGSGPGIFSRSAPTGDRPEGVTSAPPTMPLLFDCADELDALRAIRLANEFERVAMILGSGLEFRRLAAIGGPHTPMYILPVNYPQAPKMESIAEADSIELREMMTWEQAPTNARRLRDAGIHAAFTTSKSRTRGRFWDNVRLAVRHGLDPDDALAMVTTFPAMIAGIRDQVGVVSEGLRANLTITDGDWFDPNATEGPGSRKAKIRDVWIDGVRHEVSPAVDRGLAGTWDLEFTPARPGFAEGRIRVWLTFDEDHKLSITRAEVGSDGKASSQTVKPREQRYDQQRLSFTFEHEPFGEPGVFITQAVAEGDVMHGEFIRSSGVRMKFVAARRPSPAAMGEWVVESPGGGALGAPAATRARISITRDAVSLAFLAPDGRRTPVKAEKAAVGPDIKKRMEADAGTPGDGPADPTLAQGFAASFVYALDKVGGKGTASVTMSLDESPADVVRGTVAPSKGDDQEEPAAVEFTARRMSESDLAAERRSQRPTGMEGTWRLTLVDDDPRLASPRPESPTHIVVDPSGAVTIKSVGSDGSPSEIPARVDSVSDRRVSYTLDAGDGGVTRVEGRRFNDLLIGSMVTADGVNRTWKAGRVAVWGDEAGDDDAEILSVASTPEAIVYPFGPYGALAPPEARTVVVRGATVWTSGPAGIIENGTVVFESGRVSRVSGQGESVLVPDGALVIEAAGKHLTPGLIDCHSHTGISRGVNEGGQAVTAEVRIGDVTNPDAISWYRQLAGGITTVNSLHGSANAIGGQNQVNKNRWGAMRPEDLHFEGAMPGIKFALGENPRQANSSRSTQRYPRSRMGVEALLRDRFTAGREYLRDRGSPGFRRDLELEALGEILEGRRLVHCHSYRQDEILMLCRLAEEFGFKIGTFQHILEGYKVADELARHSGGGSAFSDWWAYKVEVQDAIPQAGPIMHEQGVVVSYNSDSDEMARRMNVEAAKAVKYSVGPDAVPGISPADALAFVTINPARQLMIHDRVGSLEVGKDADFVIWSGDPLSVFSKTEETWIDGRRYFSLEMDRASRERIAAERTRLTQKILGGLTSSKAGKSSPGEEAASESQAPPTETRRRRRPSSEGDSDSLESATAGALSGPPVDWWLRRYYMDLYLRGLPIESARPGECGCYEN
ncbi:MAG: amidohydrolase family protein [Phycisphaeraceae bacterium]|nr:amidohydrolase family protein [Phycisphaerae bacterium]MBX3393103.1 amidohydrolase family protein [Phycisphaeraceae bacterium]